MNERADFIARMVLQGWSETDAGLIYDHGVEVSKLRAKLDDIERQRDDVTRQLTHIRAGAARANNRIEQILGAALGYPRYCDDPTNFPGATEADGVCVGDHVAESLAEEAARRIVALEGGKMAGAESSTDYRFLYNELAATQLRDRARLDVARDALGKLRAHLEGSRVAALEILGGNAMRRIVNDALDAITNDGESE